jgi:hypothetical protein
MQRIRWSKNWLLSLVVISGCATIGVSQFEKLYGPPEPSDRVVGALSADQIDYWTDVKPVVENRCVVCHGCYDAPCQLKMSSIEGIVRGASPEVVYDQGRIKPAMPTRLFTDAQTVNEWRDKGFHPVLSEYASSPEANREASVMYKILQLKQENPLPDVKQLPEKEFDLKLSRKQVCTNADEFDKYAKKHPLWGMPYALPAISKDEQQVLMSWVEQGATYTARPPLPKAFTSSIEQWEAFLNGDSLKQQLTSRYIYEHLSYAHLYFSDMTNDDLQFFRMVRSTTPPGEPVAIIAGRRPYDDPDTGRVYYRLEPVVGSIVDKTHMPYALNSQRMEYWQELFIDSDYEVTTLPSYAPEQASNPFVTFAQLPVKARYRFMLEEAQFTIMAFIKGPVCRGEVAVDVIDDHFWVFFANPALENEALIRKVLQEEADNLQLPASTETIYRIGKYWREYRKKQQAFLARKAQFIADNYSGSNEVTLANIWDGDSTNSNAALTVFRNDDNATVEKGLIGKPTKTAWVIDYSLLERIHYLLVAGYDVFGNVGHQLSTRLYMDFLRMEGESNFLLLLPEQARLKERAYWYRDAKPEVLEYVASPTLETGVEPNIDYLTDDPKLELYAMLEERLSPVLPQKFAMTQIADDEIRAQLERLNQMVGTSATLLPENTNVRIRSAAGDQYVTILRNTAFSNQTALFNDNKNRLPAEDTLTVVPGFIGAYPNAFYVIDAAALPDFVDAVSNLQTEVDYAALLDNWGIRRTDNRFWPHSDNVHTAYRAYSPVTFGRLDYNRLENR